MVAYTLCKYEKKKKKKKFIHLSFIRLIFKAQVIHLITLNFPYFDYLIARQTFLVSRKAIRIQTQINWHLWLFESSQLFP